MLRIIFIILVSLLIACSTLPSDPVLREIIQDESLTEYQKQTAIFERTGVMKYGFGFTNWPDHIKRAIRSKEIVTGMTKTQVTASWGNPLRVFSNSYGDTWQYGGLFYGTRRGYLYFDNKDILTHWSMM